MDNREFALIVLLVLIVILLALGAYLVFKDLQEDAEEEARYQEWIKRRTGTWDK